MGQRPGFRQVSPVSLSSCIRTQIGHTAMWDVGSTRLWVECALADNKCPCTVVSSQETLGRPPAVVHHRWRRSVTYAVGQIQRVGPSPLFDPGHAKHMVHR